MLAGSSNGLSTVVDPLVAGFAPATFSLLGLMGGAPGGPPALPKEGLAGALLAGGGAGAAGPPPADPKVGRDGLVAAPCSWAGGGEDAPAAPKVGRDGLAAAPESGVEDAGSSSSPCGTAGGAGLFTGGVAIAGAAATSVGGASFLPPQPIDARRAPMDQTKSQALHWMDEHTRMIEDRPVALDSLGECTVR